MKQLSVDQMQDLISNYFSDESEQEMALHLLYHYREIVERVDLSSPIDENLLRDQRRAEASAGAEGQDVFQMIKEMKVLFGIDEETALQICKPDWAVGANKTYEVKVGAQLCTKDGRRMGNAHVSEMVHNLDDDYFQVLTDAGNRVMMTEREIRQRFYISPWISDVEEVVRKFGSRKGE